MARRVEDTTDTVPSHSSVENTAHLFSPSFFLFFSQVPGFFLLVGLGLIYAAWFERFVEWTVSLGLSPEIRHKYDEGDSKFFGRSFFLDSFSKIVAWNDQEWRN